MDENHFDRISDDLLRLIFNKVLDAKSLCRCLSVSKRFSSVIPQTDTLSLAIPLVSGSKPNLFTILIDKFITKPLQYLHLIPKSGSELHVSYYYPPPQLLKSFGEVRRLQIQLPAFPRGELTPPPVEGDDTDGSCFLKWNAAFGTQLKSCVILGAKSFQKSNTKSGKDETNAHRQEGSMISNDELKLRVAWTISCLIAASTRHSLLKQMILDRPMLRRVEITDEKRQGKVYMGEEDVAETRKNGSAESESERSRVPALRMKMWYVPALELPATGNVVEGATLVMIRAVDTEIEKGGCCACDDDLLKGAFDCGEEEKAYGEAVKEMVDKKKMYTLEIDSF